jgi:hypothetical protein
MEQKKDNAACPHRWRQVINGPMITVYKCSLCGHVDVIDRRGPRRIEIDRAGRVWEYGVKA